MRKSTMTFRRMLRDLAVLTCAGLGSCVSMDTTSVEDYIGRASLRPRSGRAASQPAILDITTRPSISSKPATMADSTTTAPSLPLTVDDAIFVSLENNRSLAVERLKPQIGRTQEQQQLAAFDPVLTAGATYGRTRITRGTTSQVADEAGAQIGAQTFLPTGTTLQINGNTNVQQGDFRQDDSWTSRAELTARQALARGAGLDVNLVSVRQAKIDTRISQYELRGFVQELVAQVEKTYWDCVLAQRGIEIVESSLAVAEQQYKDTAERIRVGKLAEVELAAAEAEVALRRENLINAKSLLATNRLKLWSLLNPRGVEPAGTTMKLITPPGLSDSAAGDVGAHVEYAMRMRPDINQARLLIQKNSLELVRTRNGLLPQMDLFITLGGTGYANAFGRSTHHLGDRNYDVLVGIQGEFPPLNREARAQHQRATLNRDQAMLALDNLSQLAEVDVRGACIELERTREQVRATAVTRRLQEETLRVETEKLAVDKSTSLLVAQAQRDLLTSQLAEIEAVVTHLKALVELRRLEGSLLSETAIACPGDQPINVDVPSWRKTETGQ